MTGRSPSRRNEADEATRSGDLPTFVLSRSSQCALCLVSAANFDRLQPTVNGIGCRHRAEKWAEDAIVIAILRTAIGGSFARLGR